MIQINFVYLDKKFFISGSSDPYQVMSDMDLHSIEIGEALVLAP